MPDVGVQDDDQVIGFAPDIDTETQTMVAELLAEWLSPAALEDMGVSILAGGAVNRSFLVVVGGEKYVLRVAPPAEDTHQIGIDMANSATVARIAGEAGVGPRVVGVKQPEGHSLIEFLPGVLNVDTLRGRGRLDAVGRCVRALHELHPQDVRAVSAFVEIDDWLASAAAQGVQGAGDLAVLRPKLEAAREVMEGVAGRCLSHRDLNPQNCIHTGREARLIDWDFSGVDTPYLDLAMLITYADLGATEADEFLGAALGDVRREDRARVQLMRFAHAIREWAWTLMARAPLMGRTKTDLTLLPTEADAQADFYTAYGDVNWRFAQRFASDPDFDDWLTTAASPLAAPGAR